MPCKLLRDPFGGEIPQFDAAIVRRRSENVRVSGAQRRSKDSIPIFEQQLLFAAGKIVKRERLLVIEEERIATKKHRRPVLVAGASKGLDALVLTKFSKVAPFE